MYEYDDTFLIDLSYLHTPSEIVYDLTSILENEASHGKRVRLVLGEPELNKSQLLSIKSLVNSVNSSLAVVEGSSDVTREAALSAGLVFQKMRDSLPENYMPAQSTEEEDFERLEPEESATEVIDDTTEVRDEAYVPSEPEDKGFEDSFEGSVSEDENPENGEGFEEITENNFTEENALREENVENPVSDTVSEELDVIYADDKKLTDFFDGEPLKPEKYAPMSDISANDENEFTKFDFELENFDVKYLRQTVCAGQNIYFNGNLVIIGDCREGSEIKANGDIVVWGTLKGSAFAGCEGNEKARIRALKMDASLLRISNSFIQKDPEALEKTEIAPEEAKIVDGNIEVYKILQ